MPNYNDFISQNAAFSSQKPLTVFYKGVSKQDIVLGDLKIHTCKNHWQFTNYTFNLFFAASCLFKA